MAAFLIDTGALLAMIDRSDKHYRSANEFIRAHVRDYFYLPETIFAETMTLTKARLGSHAAVELGNRLMQSSLFVIVELSEEDKLETWHIFTRYQDKDWSYPDCALYALSRRLEIRDVFAFDHHFDQMADVIRVPTLST